MPVTVHLSGESIEGARRWLEVNDWPALLLGDAFAYALYDAIREAVDTGEHQASALGRVWEVAYGQHRPSEFRVVTGLPDMLRRAG